MHLDTGSYFRSVRKIAVTPFDQLTVKILCTHTSPLCVCVVDAELFYTATNKRIRHETHPSRVYPLWTFFGPVTVTLTRRPSHTNLTRITWRYTGCANMNFLVSYSLRTKNSENSSKKNTDIMTLLAWPDFTGLHCNMLRGQNSTKFDIGLSSMLLKFKCYLVSKRGSRKGDCGRKSRPNFILIHPPPVKLCKNLRGILWCTMGLAIKAQTYWRDVGCDLQVAMLQS